MEISYANSRIRKTRLYLDTSVVSAIDAPHKPKIELETKQFFRYVRKRADEYELLVSPVLQEEIANCQEPKRALMQGFLEHIPTMTIEDNTEALDLANTYVQEKVLKVKHFSDLTHIAYAVVCRCDYIVSWNFEHFVNEKTMSRVNIVNRLHNYRDVIIITPTTFIIGDHHD